MKHPLLARGFGDRRRGSKERVVFALALTAFGATARAEAPEPPPAPLVTAPVVLAPTTMLTSAAPLGSPAPSGTSLLSWYGSIENDIGYARYDAEEKATIDDTFYDHRGRFVVAPFLHLDVGRNYYVEATGQVVAWIKEQVGRYQINADDVWARFGRKGLWDVQIGRFEAWRVYQKFPLRNRDPRPYVQMIESAGAFDLFTLEDTGALCNPPVSSGGYCADIYEVGFILLRDEAPSVAFHLYPTQRLQLELHAKYGEEGQQNQRGLRGALLYRPFDFVLLSGAAEVRQERTSSPPKNPDPEDMERTIECVDCGREDKRGAGGGITIFLGPFEVSGNAAIGYVDTYQAVNGEPFPDGSPTFKSFGGYAQVAVGPIVVGGAANLTDRVDPAENFQRHLQTAGYLYWPFAKELSLKAVVSYAQGENDPANLRGNREPPVNEFIGARIRLKYLFNTF